MKREYVLPDLLASMTADALFAGPSPKSAAKAGGRKPGSRFGRWFKTAPQGDAAPVSPPANLALEDDWVGGWYARTRLLQAATLAQPPENGPANANSAAGRAEGGAHVPTVDVVTQMKDYI